MKNKRIPFNLFCWIYWLNSYYEIMETFNLATDLESLNFYYDIKLKKNYI